MRYKECDKRLLVSFAARATGVALQICVFVSGRQGFPADSLLLTATVSVAGGYLFGGLTRRNNQVRSPMNYCSQYQFIHSRCDSAYIDVGCKCLMAN